MEDRVAALAGEIVTRRTDGLSVDRVEFEREGGRWYLRVFLDHPSGVTLDHCQEVARELGEALDRVDPIEHAYSLEVSSPGLERPLRKDEDFHRFKGRLVTLHFYRSRDGRKSLTGRLGGLTAEGEVALEVKAKGLVRVPRSEVAKAHLAVDWEIGSGGGDQ